MLHSNTAIYKWYINNNTPIVEVTQKSSNISFRLNANDFLTLLNTGVSKYVQTIEGNFIMINFNLRSKHLYMNGSDINTGLTDVAFLNALKKGLSDLISATYTDDSGEGNVPW